MADMMLIVPLALLFAVVTAQILQVLAGTAAPGRKTFVICLALAAAFPFLLHWAFPQVAFGIRDDDGFTPHGLLILFLMVPVTFLLGAALFLVWLVLTKMDGRARLIFALIMLVVIATAFLLAWLFPDLIVGGNCRLWRQIRWSC